MTGEQWRRVWAVYESACEMPASLRAEFVSSSLEDDALRSKALELLSRADDSTDPASTSGPSTAESRWDRATGDRPRESALAGQTLGRFKILTLLGRGGMGEVYEALDPELERHVAIKCIAPTRLGTNRAVDSIIREARAASALNHPGIVTVFEVIRTSETVAIVMELVEGQPFRQLAAQPQPVKMVALWGQRIAEALATTHARGILHRDIKPENLIVRPDGYVKILDFGLALEGSSSGMTGPLGTVRYMSPEQSRGGPLTSATDIFSLGVVLYELATGVHPYAAAGGSNTTLSIAQRVARLEPPAPSTVVHSLPPAFDRLVLRMLSKDPTERPAAEAVAQELSALPARLRLPRHIGIGAGVVAALLLATYVAAPRALLQQEPAEIVGTLLTGSPGREGDPAFSPDGKWLAYAWDGGSGTKRDIYVKPLQVQPLQDSGGDPVRLTNTPEDEWSPSWSPDGARVAFLRRTEDAFQAVVVPVGGGPGQIVSRLTPVQSILRHRVTWSGPAELVFADDPLDGNGEHQYGSAMQLYAAAVDSGTRRLLLPPEERGVGFDHSPRLSPDGKWIGFTRVSRKTSELRIGPASGGASRSLAQNERGIQGWSWAPDSSKLYYHPSGARRLNDLWQVSVSGGPAGRAPLAFRAGAWDLALSPDGRTAAYVVWTRDSNIWTVSASGPAPRPVIASSRTDDDAAYSPDGSRIAFASNRTDYAELYVADASGANPRRLTSLSGHSGSPVWSPDGHTLAFDWHDDRVTQVWTVNVDGGAPSMLEAGDFGGWVPGWSRDGRWIYFASNRSGSAQIWRTPVQGGAPQQITRAGGFESKESPDGKYLFYSKGSQGRGIWRVTLDALERGEEKVADFDPVRQFRCWDIGATGFYFGVGGVQPHVELQLFGGGPARFVSPLPRELPITSRCLSAHPNDGSFLYSVLDSERQEIYLARLDGSR